MLTPEERWSLADMIMSHMADKSDAPETALVFRCVETIAGKVFVHNFERIVSHGISTFHMTLTTLHWMICAELEFGTKVKMTVVGDEELCDTDLMYVLFSGEAGHQNYQLLERLREHGVTTIHPN